MAEIQTASNVGNGAGSSQGSEAKKPPRGPMITKGGMITTLNVSYYLLPFVYGAFIYAIVDIGHGWFMSLTTFLNAWNPLSVKILPDTVGVVVMYRLTLIVVLVMLVRLFIALAIPPERTIQQNVDMILALVPLGMIGYLVGEHHFLHIPMGLIETYFLQMATILSVVMDLFGARLAQKIIGAYRRRIDASTIG